MLEGHDARCFSGMAEGRCVCPPVRRTLLEKALLRFIKATDKAENATSRYEYWDAVALKREAEYKALLTKGETQ